MAYVRIKHIKRNCYAYFVKSYWVPGVGSRQKVLGYIGRMKGLPNIDFHELLKKAGYKCENCEFMQDLTVDHKVPVSKGGSNHPDNLWILCKKCNSRKGAKMPDEKPKPQQYQKWYY